MRQSIARLGGAMTLVILGAITGLSCQASQAPTLDPIRGMVGVGTWNTQAEFKDIRVSRDNATLLLSDFSHGMAGWKTPRGQWQAVDGMLRQAGGEENTLALAGDPNWSDYTLTLKARKLGGKEGFLILFGLPDENTKSWWNLGGWGNTRHGIEAPATRGQQAPGTIETGRWYDIKVELSGDTIRAYLDNQLIETATQIPGTHTVAFNTQAAGKKLPLTRWGLDTAWAVPDHMRRGLLYMGKEHVNVVRVSFPVNEPLVDGDLPASKDEHFTTRLAIARMAGDKPFTMLPDTEAGVNLWYKTGKEIIPGRWVQLMAAAQRRYGKKMESVEAFNEADYGWGQGSARNLNDILGLLQTTPDFAGVQMSGPSTLNADAAGSWYGATKDHLQRGTTHSLAGSFDSYLNFYRDVAASGQRLENPEVHNLVEVISGAENGLQQAIWWNTAERARGEFVNAVQGERLAYAEDRPRWTAAAVYRAPSGKVQAFVGSSERMGQTSTYRFVCEDRPVFFNGEGPQREFSVPVRQNGEHLVDITWGEDVAPKLTGKCVIVNHHSGKVLGVVGANQADGADVEQTDYSHAANQQWEVAPFVSPVGDQSYFTIRAGHSGKSLDTADWNFDEGGKIQQWGKGDAGAQHWYFEYAGDNYFYIRSRWSTECLGVANGSSLAGASVQQFSRAEKDDANLQWRLVPVGALEQSPLDFVAPTSPTGLTVAAQQGKVALRWTANREADLASYTVFRSNSAAGPYDTIARDVAGNSFNDGDVAAGQTYFYKIKAFDRSLNQSSFSATVSATP